MLTKAQKKSVEELEEFIELLGLNHKDIGSVEYDAILPMLKSMKDHYIRGQVIQDYTLIDELLGAIICKYFFDKKTSFIKHWKTKKFRNFNYFILEKLYLGQKLDLVKNIIKVDAKLESRIRRINDLRNALAHTFFPENLKGKKRHFYNGTSIFTKRGLQIYMEEKREIIDFLMKKAYGVDVSNYNFRT